MQGRAVFSLTRGTALWHRIKGVDALNEVEAIRRALAWGLQIERLMTVLGSVGSGRRCSHRTRPNQRGTPTREKAKGRAFGEASNHWNIVVDYA